MNTILFALSRSMPVASALDVAAQHDAPAVRRDRRVQEVDLAALVDLDVLVDRGRVRRRSPEDGLRRLEPLGLDVEAVLGAEGAAVARQENDVVLLDDGPLRLLQAVVVEGQRRLAGPREAEEQEPDVAELAGPAR